MSVELFSTYKNQRLFNFTEEKLRCHEKYAVVYAQCRMLANQFAETIARKTGKYKIAQEIENAYNEVCLDKSDVRKSLLAFGESGKSNIQHQHEQNLEKLIRIANSKE